MKSPLMKPCKTLHNVAASKNDFRCLSFLDLTNSSNLMDTLDFGLTTTPK